LVWLVTAAAQTHKSAPAKKAPARTTAKKSSGTARKSTATKRKSASTRRRTTRGRAVTWRNRQTVPTADRYKEIQNALVTRGYLGAEDANGVWGPNSIDALKRFQTAQNLDATGKINSLSLIALGLGPSHTNTAAATPAPPKPEPQPDPGR